MLPKLIEPGYLSLTVLDSQPPEAVSVQRLCQSACYLFWASAIFRLSWHSHYGAGYRTRWLKLASLYVLSLHLLIHTTLGFASLVSWAILRTGLSPCHCFGSDTSLLLCQQFIIFHIYLLHLFSAQLHSKQLWVTNLWSMKRVTHGTSVGTSFMCEFS